MSCLSSHSTFEVDHAFIGCEPGAPEASALLRLGFVEGSSNTHPGQGTANRRFFFENFMLELLWIADAADAQSESTRRTRLWDRCERRQNGVNPCGIVFRSAEPQRAPFPAWPYTPNYLPAGMSIQVAEGTSLSEPELFYLPFLRRGSIRSSEPLFHALPIRRVRELAAGVPCLSELSAASRIVESDGLVQYFKSPRPVLEIRFQEPADICVDLQPDLPLVFRSTRS